MCGIAGIISAGIDLRERKNVLEKMSETLRMRGPDGDGKYITGEAALIHRNRR